MVEGNLDKTRLNNVPESYILTERKNRPGYEGSYCME